MRPLLPVLAIGATVVAAAGVFLLRGDSPSSVTATTYAGIAPDERLPQELKPLVQRLGSPDAVERAQAVLELRALGPRSEAAVPYLARLLPDRSRIRIERDLEGNDVGPLDRGGTGYFTCPGALAARALAHAGGSGIDALLKGISHKSDDVRRSALDGAGYAADPRVIPPTIRALADDNGLIREAAHRAEPPRAGGARQCRRRAGSTGRPRLHPIADRVPRRPIDSA